ncbi:MAG: hypothetical protein ACI8X3_003019, partial [Saprospiraceae bacterium]
GLIFLEGYLVLPGVLRCGGVFFRAVPFYFSVLCD